MDNKIQPSAIYTTIINIKGGEEDYMLNEKEHQEQQCENNFAIKDLLQIHITLIHQTTMEDPFNNRLGNATT